MTTFMKNGADNGFHLLEGERLDDLQINGLRIIQHPGLYCFSSDAVLLANFAKAKYGETVVDMGTGSGIIAFLLAAGTRAKMICGVELQESLAGMARRSAEGNGLTPRVKILNADMRTVYETIGREAADVVTVNPPYRPAGSGDKSAKNESTKIARHEVTITLPEVIESAARLLKFGGRLYMIHRADRLDDIFFHARQSNIAVKALRLVQPKADKPPHLVLIEGQKGGKPGVCVGENVIITDNV